MRKERRKKYMNYCTPKQIKREKGKSDQKLNEKERYNCVEPFD